MMPLYPGICDPLHVPNGPGDERIHVVSLIDDLAVTGGGAETMARELALRLDPTRFRCTLCVTRLSPGQPNGAELALIRELEGQGVRVLSLARRGKLHLHAWRPLVSYLRRERVQVLHGHMFGSNVWAALIGPLAGVPVVVAHEHGWSYEGQPMRRILDRVLVARSSDAIIASSELARARMIEVERIDPRRTRLEYIRNGIAQPVPSGRPVRADLGISDGAPLVLAVARLDPYKSLPVLVQAAAQLRDEFPGLRVAIAGEGRERGRLERLIAELRLGDVVRLLGARSDVPDLIAACDVATLCSYSETTPLAIMEYMALEKPVVATRAGGIPDLIEDRVEGLLIPPGDSSALAEAIATLLRDPEFARELGRRAGERQRRDFSIDSVARRVEALYRELLLARSEPTLQLRPRRRRPGRVRRPQSATPRDGDG
jgi:glycosyltransferase involved in cell wall biosynthesis